MSVNNDIRQTSEHTTPVHSSSATARNDDSATPVHGSTLTMWNDDSATMSGSNDGDKRQTSEYKHTTLVCPGISTIGDWHHEETEKVKTYLVWLITITACKYNQRTRSFKESNKISESLSLVTSSLSEMRMEFIEDPNRLTSSTMIRFSKEPDWNSKIIMSTTTYTRFRNNHIKQKVKQWTD